MVLTIIVNLLLTPFLIHQLGVTAYGFWTLVLTLSIAHGFLSFADFGIASSIVKIVGGSAAAENRELTNATVSGGAMLLGALGIFLGAMILLGTGFLQEVFDVEPGLMADSAILLRLMAVVVFLDLVKLALSATLQGFQEFARAKLIQVVGLLLQAGLMVFLVYRGDGLPGLGLAAATASATQLVLLFLALRRAIPWWRLTLSIPHDTWSNLLRTSSIILVIRLQAAVHKGMDRIIIGLFLLPAVLTQYDIVFKLAGVGIACITVISSMMVSPAAESAANNNTQQLSHRFISSTKVALLLSLSVVVIIFCYAGNILSLWVGPEFTEIAPEARMLAGNVIAVALMASAQNMFIGTGRLKMVALVTTATTALNLCLSLLLVVPLGLSGVILATLISTALSAVLFLYQGMHHFSVSIRDTIRRLLLPGLAPAVVSLALYAILIQFLPALSPVFSMGLVLVSYLGVALGFSVSREEWKFLCSYFSELRPDRQDS
ncbi:MAG: polysaccharide biosynthesis C-terminal domain-containing protein [Puniceicoccaceae bacterium]